MLFTGTPTAASAQSIGITVSFGPPPIPYYVQPPAPEPNYIWSPGYWGYDPNSGYYWVPGTWVPAPQYGYLWTPGYWAFNGVAFVFSSGYWAPEVGWYGGVDYGYGYYGNGYRGGRWRGHEFLYNTAVTNVNRTIVRNVYVDRTVVNNNWNRVSYNGGRGGLAVRPSQSQLAVARGPHIGPTSVQVQHARFASTNRAFASSVNHGRPATAAVARPFTAANHPAAQRFAAPNRAAAAPQEHRAAVQQQHAFAPAHQAAPQARMAAPQHVAPAPRAAAPQQHFAPAPQQRMAAPQQHSAPAPQQRMAAPQQHSAPAPQQRMAAPAAHAAPAAPAAGGGDKRDEHGH